MPSKRPDRVLGAGHDEFWNWCKQDELRLQQCKQCQKIAWPVVTYCEQCGSDQFDWTAMSGKGKVISWCTFEHDYYQGTFPIPHPTILVELEEGPLFISNPCGFSLDDIQANDAVNLTFIACEDANGLYKLPLFKKA